MIKASKILLITVCLVFGKTPFSQDRTNTSAEYLTWSLLQIIPSPVFFQDAGNNNARIQFGLRWQVIPLNVSFRSNKYISPFQFFKINPVRKFTGSMELFVQPEWATAGFKYSNLGRFGLSAGSRIIIPVSGDGENLSASIGGKYNYRKDLVGVNNGYFGIEAGVYAIYGVLGLQLNYNFDKRSRYSFGVYFKYF
jgi:hypothetical protein